MRELWRSSSESAAGLNVYDGRLERQNKTLGRGTICKHLGAQAAFPVATISGAGDLTNTRGTSVEYKNYKNGLEVSREIV
ncbi:MAG: hypothetical protein ACKVS6_16195 [Planctomycetota bacterium]